MKQNIKTYVILFIMIIMGIAFVQEMGNAANAQETETIEITDQFLNVSPMRIGGVGNNVNESYIFSINDNVSVMNTIVMNVLSQVVSGCVNESLGDCDPVDAYNWTYIPSSDDLRFINNTYMVDGGGKNQNWFIDYSYEEITAAIEGNELSIVNVTIIMCILSLIIFMVAVLFYKKKT